MSYDDRILRENVIPIRRDAPVPLPGVGDVQIIRPDRRPRDVEAQLYSLHREVDDLHARDGAISARTAILGVLVGTLVMDRYGWWPLPWLVDLAGATWFTVFASAMVVFVGTAGLLAAVPSLLRRHGWMS